MGKQRGEPGVHVTGSPRCAISSASPADVMHKLAKAKAGEKSKKEISI